MSVPVSATSSGRSGCRSRNSRTLSADRPACKTTMASAASSSYLSSTATAWPSWRSSSAQRSAVTRFPRREPGGAGVTIARQLIGLPFGDSYDERGFSENAMRFVLFALMCGLVWATPACAHYHMLLPDRHSVKTGDKVIVTYQFGHPFEHELFDAEKPAKAVAFDPVQKSVDLLPSFEKVEVPGREGKKVAAYRFTFQPAGRGDYTIIVESPPIWMADEKHFFHDICRVTIHVDAQKGWDYRF